jgi:hypothetical protein
MKMLIYTPLNSSQRLIEKYSEFVLLRQAQMLTFLHFCPLSLKKMLFTTRNWHTLMILSMNKKRSNIYEEDIIQNVSEKNNKNYLQNILKECSE